MQIYSREYSAEDDGFEGSCEAYLISTKKENLFNWLEKEISEPEKLYKIIQELIEDILIIKNINVDEEYQGQGNGGQILSDLMNESFANGAILVCDIGESQKEGFVLEKFYESNNFKTILKTNDYPLMVYPVDLAEKILKIIENDLQTKKPKLK